MLMFIYRGAEAVGEKDLEGDVQERKGRDVTKISSCGVNTTREQGISCMQGFSLVIFFSFFPMKVAWGHIYSSRGNTPAPTSQ